MHSGAGLWVGRENPGPPRVEMIDSLSHDYALAKSSPCSGCLLPAHCWQLILNMAIQLANKHAQWRGWRGHARKGDLGPVGRLVETAPFSLSDIALSALVPAADRAGELRVFPYIPCNICGIKLAQRVR